MTIETHVKTNKAERFSQFTEEFTEAKKYFPGGVNSPVRSFGSVGGTPLFAASGSGPRLRDAHGHNYIDLCCSWGALPLGHTDPRVQAALSQQLQMGFSFGMPTAGETQFAALLQQLLPQLEQLRFVNSGTEACMSALRLARAHTGRNKVLKFKGCYHGHADYLLTGSGKQTNKPSSSGVPQELANLCLTVPYNDLAAAQRLLAGGEIAAVIVEPVAANMGLVLPQDDFLPGLRQACSQNGSLLIFDEVITGLRLPGPKGTNQPACAAAYFGVVPELSCFGKAIGGGLPLAVYGGQREIMAHLAPQGDCYQAGTLSGNPLATTAGLATVKALLEDWNVAHPQWNSFIAELEPLLRQNGAALTHCGSLMTIYPQASHAPRNFYEAQNLAKAQNKTKQNCYAQFFHFMLERNIYLSPSPYETLFLSTAHQVDTLDFILQQITAYFQQGF